MPRAGHGLRPRQWTTPGLAGFCFLVSLALCGRGADWPQYRGPNHDGISTDRLNRQWTGPVTNPVWRVLATNGLSSFAVSDGRAFTQARRDIGGLDQEVCLALSITNGAELWATAVDMANYPGGGVGGDDGPRSTPSVDGGSVYVLSSYLKLTRLDTRDGSMLWQRDLLQLYGGTLISWQNAASPLIENGLIYLNANCRPSTLLALRTGDGSLAWRSQDELMTHSTPVLASIQGVRQVIFASQTGLVSVDPATGTRLWKFTYPFRYTTCLAVSPVVSEDMVFVCGAHAYGMGSVVVQASHTNHAWAARQLWYTNNPASRWMTPVCHQGYLYGTFGIQSYDSVSAQLKCVDLRTGAVRWSTNGFGRGGTLLVDNHLVTLTERGALVLARANPDAYTPLGRFQAIPNHHGDTNKCWNSPAVCDGRIYVRSTAYAACFDLSIPDLKFDPPQPLPSGSVALTARTVNGTSVVSNRLAGLEVRAATNLTQNLDQWVRLTNSLRLTNGAVVVAPVESGNAPRQFFILREPN